MGLYFVVEDDRAFHQIVLQRLNQLLKVDVQSFNEKVHKATENSAQTVAFKLGCVEQMKVPQTPQSHVVPAAGGWKHCPNKNYILKELEVLGFKVVPAVVIHPLAEQLNRRLRPVLVLLGHVQVVDEDDTALLAVFRPEVALPPPTADFEFDCFLELVGSGLATEGDIKVGGFSSLEILVQLLEDCGSLACPRLADD